MGELKFSVHPLTFLFGLYSALMGKIFDFIIYTLSALIHEIGHSFVASSFGYRLNKITLMPYGAVVSGDTDGLKPKDEIKIALAGPFINLCIGLLFVAFWWIYPEIYAFTDIVVEANLSLACVNLIPALPLDGGRVIYSLLDEAKGEKFAKAVCKTLGFVLSALLLTLFIISCFTAFNLSVLFFALFVFFGVMGKCGNAKYVKIYAGVSEEMLKRGVPVKRQALDKSVSVRKMLKCLDERAINEIAVFDNGKEIEVLTQEKITNIIEKGDLYSAIEKYLTMR